MNRAMSHLIAEGVILHDGYKLFLQAESPEKMSAFSCDLVVARRSSHIPGYRRLAKEMGIKLTIHTWNSVEDSKSLSACIPPVTVASARCP